MTEGATLVVSVNVRPGLTEEYRRWQDRVIAAATDFTGCEATQVHPPESGEGEQWVIAFRFSQPEQLTAWLHSDVRRSLLEEGDALIVDQRIQDVLLGGAPAHRRPVTAIISHEVLPGRERDYEHWRDEVLEAARTFPGFTGSEVFEPVAGIQERWVTLIRFDTRGDLDNWLKSDVYTEQLEVGRQNFAIYQVRKVASGFSGWFRFDKGDKGMAPDVPPNWKQAFAVLLALYPIVVFLSYGGSALGDIGTPVFVQLFVESALSVAALTWIAMPVVNRFLAFWLIPSRVRTTTRQLAGVGIVVLGWAVSVSFFGFLDLVLS
ncbi:antibiotic biosynthesis monooxygenase [Nocardia sp. CNY236]|uniref:antibiotic biosynthesis monooxygenase n=1 Tax=Nocardia sp. CNY236 TaxID=1169152 RepID=UPI00055C8598|nr:antibiotic biosynthesis monooxygenase [Nocardia sp. CNY236]